MINAPQLLADLKRRLTLLDDDLRQRISELPDLKASLQSEWQAARTGNRTAETFESWADQVITQAGVHWLLSCVFLRFIEDNKLVDRPWISGTPDSGRLNLARDRHEAYFRTHPLESDREYLIACFREAGALPGLHTFFDESHNPVFRLGISGDAAMGLRQFWQHQDPNTGALLHDFTDTTWNTRFLGDLYQDLSEATRKRYALLQTPEFVEEFILDRTLTPAIREFGYKEVRMIDPTCGSGHFLLGGFHRMVNEWSRAEPARNRRDVAQKALDAVSGVDLNPFAVAISRFRLLVAALEACDVHHLTEAPDFKINVAIGDSLLHGTRFGLTATEDMFQQREHFANTGLSHTYASEELTEVQRILSRQYHAVVGNPPYIVVKDTALNAAYRLRYASCHRKYSLGAPFTERFFELAVTGRENQVAGFVGQITANSFMKREFGSKLIEQVLPRLDLTHVIDTAGAYIPGHGTPTVILFGRHRAPVSDSVRTAMGIRGEPSTPIDPAFGQVWSAILGQIDRPGSESDFISVTDTSRAVFGRHPWSIGGGGASDILDALREVATESLGDLTVAIGRTMHTGEDNIFFVPPSWPARNGMQGISLPLVEGESVRDFTLDCETEVIFPYDRDSAEVLREFPSQLARHFWTYRRLLRERKDFGNYVEARGLLWYEHSMFFPDRYLSPNGIAFAFVGTHNHFVLDHGSKVFNKSAPVIKLPVGASEDEHLGLLGILNSSVACFWMKQIFHNKGSTVDQHGARQRTNAFEDFYEFTGTGLKDFPLSANRPLEIASRLDNQARELASLLPAALLTNFGGTKQPLPTRDSLEVARTRANQIRRLMIANQEELDWCCYRHYDLLTVGKDVLNFEYGTPPEVALGERAFEIVLARRMLAGGDPTSWFERHGSTPITEIPSHWPEDYRRVIQSRIDVIESDRSIGLIERPEYKRRWNSPSWEQLRQAAMREWLLTRLESPRYWTTSANRTLALTSTSRLADEARVDLELMQVASLYTGHGDFDLGQLVADLVGGEAEPFLPVLRYSDSGLRKRAQWEETWALQRREDAIDAEVESTAGTRRKELLSVVKASAGNAEPDANALNWVESKLHEELEKEKTQRKASEIGNIPIPPKYQSKDFRKSDFWRLRGGLDVPKERWISFPGCERGADGSLVVGWAGWNRLQQATALANYYLDMKDNEGWEAVRLQPLLVGLLELVPWLEQWHNELDATYGERMGNYYKGFVTEEARALGFTLDDLRGWQPAVTTVRRARRRAA